MNTQQRLEELNNSDEVTLDLTVKHGKLELKSTMTGTLKIRSTHCHLENEMGDYINFPVQAVTEIKAFNAGFSGLSGVIVVKL